jgi:copper chaperone CopZ
MLLLVPASIMAQDKNKDTATVKFKTSIECNDCVNTIMTNIPFEKGVKDVKCDLTTKEVTIVYHRNKTKPDLLKRSLEKLGYTAKEKTSEGKS